MKKSLFLFKNIFNSKSIQPLDFSILQYIDGIQNLYDIDLNIDYKSIIIPEYNSKYGIIYEYTSRDNITSLINNYYNNKDLLNNINNIDKEVIVNINKYINNIDYNYIFLTSYDSTLFYDFYIILYILKYNKKSKIIIGGPNIELSDNIIKLLNEINNDRIIISKNNIENILIDVYNLDNKYNYYNDNKYIPIYNKNSLDYISAQHKKIKDIIDNNTLIVSLSNDCNYNCAFCYCSRPQKNYRYLDISKRKYLLDYYTKNKNNYFYDTLEFSDNDILIDNNIDEFIDYFNTDLNINLFTSINNISNKLINKLNILNLTGLFIGLNEFGFVDNILFDKTLTPDNNIYIINLLHNNLIHTKNIIIMIMSLYPNYNNEILLNLKDIILYLCKNYKNFIFEIMDLSIFPNSILYNNAQDYNYIFNYNNYNNYNLPDNIINILNSIPVSIKLLNDIDMKILKEIKLFSKLFKNIKCNIQW